MKITFIGLCPYLLTARSKLHSWLLRYFYLSGHSVASIDYGHDASYFFPNDAGQFEYTFDYQDVKHSIPLYPFIRGQQEVAAIYDTLTALKPDLVVCIGDVCDFAFVDAIMKHGVKTKWMMVYMNYTSFESTHYKMFDNVFSRFDSILCVNKTAYEKVKNKAPVVDWQYVGCNQSVYQTGVENIEPRLSFCGTLMQSDMLANIMAVIGSIYPVYAHTNYCDQGSDYSIEEIKERFRVHDTLILPSYGVSIKDGVPDEVLADEFRLSSIFLSMPVVSCSAMSVFQAVSCGAWPLLSNTGTNIEIAEILAKSCGVLADEFLVESIDLIVKNGLVLSIFNPKDLRYKILNFFKKHQGFRATLSYSLQEYSHTAFMDKALRVAKETMEIGMTDTICLETVNTMENN